MDVCEEMINGMLAFIYKIYMYGEISLAKKIHVDLVLSFGGLPAPWRTYQHTCTELIYLLSSISYYLRALSNLTDRIDSSLIIK